ncbi:DUF5677 domain-containing protein [Virgibacillus halodenitrificans]|uniref:DUF5677 domain-containing protein n=1 Tax=Virgibacillus halodenitrificans TaxID=1482 RepID=UPI000EF4D892|nr:DUF5677 domain-containing protein [Virgibacillus halodenitrificans]
MVNMDKEVEKLGALVQKHEEYFWEMINYMKNKHDVISDEKIVIILLYRKIIEKLDAIFVLLDHKSEKAAESICRDMYENALYLKYIIEDKDRQNIRALSYYFSHMKDQITLGKTFVKKVKNKTKISEIVGDRKEVVLNELGERISRFNERTNENKFINIKIEWKKIEKSKKNKRIYPNWYSLFNGPNNLKELSEKFGYREEYDIIYKIFSTQVHSANALNQIENIDGVAGIKNLRIYDDPRIVFNISKMLGINALLDCVDFFGYGDKKQIARFIKNNVE